MTRLSSEGRQLVPSAYSPPISNYQRQLHAEHLARQARFLLNAIAFQLSEREGPSCSWPNPSKNFCGSVEKVSPVLGRMEDHIIRQLTKL